MAENMLSNRPDYGRTFNTAMWLVGLVAAIQLFAVAWAVFSRESPLKAIPASVILTESLPQNGIYVVPGMGGQVAVGSDITQNEPFVGSPSASFSIGDQVFAGGEFEAVQNEVLEVSEPLSVMPPSSGQNGNILPEPSFYGPESTGPSLSESLANAAFTTEKIEDPILERLVSTGEELRGAGNMSSALQALREAEAALPEHPRVLGELAATLSQMGLDSKAVVYWERIVAIGAGRGGAYYEVAKSQLPGGAAPKVLEPEKVMNIGEIKVDEQSPNSEGQRVSLRIVIDADPAQNPVGADLSLLVYFYDQIDGGRVDPSTADTSYLYPTEPYDWQINGSEEIKVIYNQPIFTEEQSRELGKRSYYGYAIELYYRDRLQDRVVMPEDIARLRMDDAESDPDSSPRSVGPENALFPNIPNL
tara:strand:+ start:3275 stop:4528 length:1254 start_codon:yes stop_codon:yes gene_type:complete